MCVYECVWVWVSVYISVCVCVCVHVCFCQSPPGFLYSACPLRDYSDGEGGKEKPFYFQPLLLAPSLSQKLIVQRQTLAQLLEMPHARTNHRHGCRRQIKMTTCATWAGPSHSLVQVQALSMN